jgi:hypothetical protein
MDVSMTFGAQNLHWKLSSKNSILSIQAYCTTCYTQQLNRTSPDF